MKPKTYYRMPTHRIVPRRTRDLGFYQPESEAVIIGEGGKEVCSETIAGQKEYKRRVEVMRLRQAKLCCNCIESLDAAEATFEHENGRGAGKRDDRIEINGKPVNGASHGICNQQRGSRRTPIWHGPGDRNFTK